MMVYMQNRHYVFFLCFIIGFFNPITILLFSFSETFTIVVPLTLALWFFMKKEELAKIGEKSASWEILVALTIYGLDILRNLLTSSVKPMFGLTDMAVSFVCICVALYGFKGLRHFVIPSVYLVVLIVGYQLEFAIEQVSGLQVFLAGLITSVVTFVTPTFNVGNLITIKTLTGGYQALAIDADCTGLKGMIAYGSLAVITMIDIRASKQKKILSSIIGLVGTFLVNIVRLLVIVLSCYVFGIDTAMAVHTYLGYGLFMIWLIVFWHLSEKFILKPVG